MKAKIYTLTEVSDGLTQCDTYPTEKERDDEFIKRIREYSSEAGATDKEAVELEKRIAAGDLLQVWAFFDECIGYGEILFYSSEHEVEIVEIAGNVIHDTVIKIGIAQRRADGSIFCWSTQADGKNYTSIEQCQLAIENILVPTFKENDFVPVEIHHVYHLK